MCFQNGLILPSNDTLQSVVLDSRTSGRAYSCGSSVEGCWRASLLTAHPQTDPVKPFIAAAESQNNPVKAPSPSSCPQARTKPTHPSQIEGFCEIPTPCLYLPGGKALCGDVKRQHRKSVVRPGQQGRSAPFPRLEASLHPSVPGSRNVCGFSDFQEKVVTR